MAMLGIAQGAAFSFSSFIFFCLCTCSWGHKAAPDAKYFLGNPAPPRECTQIIPKIWDGADWKTGKEPQEFRGGHILWELQIFGGLWRWWPRILCDFCLILAAGKCSALLFPNFFSPMEKFILLWPRGRNSSGSPSVFVPLSPPKNGNSESLGVLKGCSLISSCTWFKFSRISANFPPTFAGWVFVQGQIFWIQPLVVLVLLFLWVFCCFGLV